MSFDNEYYSGEVSEPTSYTAIPKSRYRAVIATAEFVDPVALGWKTPDNATPDDVLEMQRPFPRVRWQILENADGTASDYAGRMVDQRVDLRSGVNKKTGRPFAETRSDLIRLKKGLGPKDEVIGEALLDLADLRGLERDGFVQEAGARFAREYVGLKAVIRVITIKSKKGGDDRESVGKILLGE